MGLFDKLRNELIDIIEFLDNTQDTIVYRFERYNNEIKNNAAVLVGLITPEQNEEKVQEYLDELAFLAETAGLEPVKRYVQRLEMPNPVTFVGKGKLEEMARKMASSAVAPVPPVAEPEPAAKEETFEAAVDRLVAGGLSKGKAMAKVAQDHPDLHQDYIARFNKRAE